MPRPSAPTTRTRCRHGRWPTRSPTARSSRHHGRRQHRRPQHLPGADQHLPAGHARTTSSPGSPATGCTSSPSRAWSRRHQRRLGRGRPQLQRRLQDGLDRRRRQAVLRADLQLPVGRALPQEPSSRRRATPSRRRSDEFMALLRQDEGRRPHPDRLRRQGRLAGHGHVRHPQHAPQRLRLPHRPDGRRRVVDRSDGRGRLRDLARRSCPTPGRRARPHLAGGRAGARSTRKPGCTCWARSSASSSPARSSADLDFFAFPALGTDFDAEIGIDAPIDGFMLSKAQANVDAAKAFLECLAHAAPPRSSYLAATRLQRGGRQRRRHERLHRAAEEVGRDHRRLRRDRAVPRSRHAPGLRRPQRHAGLPAELPGRPRPGPDGAPASIQDFWDSLPPPEQD